MKILWSFLLIITVNAVTAQNYNLISNSSFEFAPTSNIYDTIINQNYCWVRANNGVIFFRAQASNIGDRREFVSRSGTYTLALLCSTPQFDRINNAIIDSAFGFRWYAETYLAKPLQSGKQYYFTLYVGDIHFSSSIHSSYHLGFVRNIGAYFSTTQLKDYSNQNRINIIPQINFTNWTPSKTDTFEYVKLTGTYTAQGGEQYLTLGNFDYYTNFYIKEYDTGFISPTGDTVGSFNALTYIDDISLVEDTTQPVISLAHFSLGNDTTICTNDTLTLGGEPYFYHYWWNESSP